MRRLLLIVALFVAFGLGFGAAVWVVRNLGIVAALPLGVLALAVVVAVAVVGLRQR